MWINELLRRRALQIVFEQHHPKSTVYRFSAPGRYGEQAIVDATVNHGPAGRGYRDGGTALVPMPIT